MQISISTQRLDPTIRGIRMLADTRLSLRRVKQAMRGYVAAWYVQRPNLFDTLDSPTHGAGRNDTHWMSPLLRESAWIIRESGEESFTCELRASELFRSQFWGQVNGMTISAKAAAALTIPVIPQAHGNSVRGYEQKYSTRLFRPRGKSYLAESAGDSLRVVYLLRKSVTIPPLLERNGNYPFPWRTDSFRQMLKSMVAYDVLNHVERLVGVRMGNQHFKF